MQTHTTRMDTTHPDIAHTNTADIDVGTWRAAFETVALAAFGCPAALLLVASAAAC